MRWTVTGTYDGSKILLDEPLPLEPGTRVMIAVHAAADPPIPSSSPPRSFIDVARSLSIEGPAEWSGRIDHSLYGPMIGEDDDPESSGT